MKNLFVSVTNSLDREVHLGDNELLNITVNTRVGEDSVRVAEVIVTFVAGVCEVLLIDENRNECGKTELDVASKESVEDIGG